MLAEIEAFKLSIDLGPEFDESRIVWYIGSSETKAKAMKIGKSIRIPLRKRSCRGVSIM